MDDKEEEANVPCSDCGEVHNMDARPWQPKPELNIDRDITAIVMAILNDGTISDFAHLVADLDRAPTMLLRACQYLAQTFLALAHYSVRAEGGTSEDFEEEAEAALEVAKDMLERTLLQYASDSDKDKEPGA